MRILTLTVKVVIVLVPSYLAAWLTGEMGVGCADARRVGRDCGKHRVRLIERRRHELTKMGKMETGTMFLSNPTPTPHPLGVHPGRAPTLEGPPTPLARVRMYDTECAGLRQNAPVCDRMRRSALVICAGRCVQMTAALVRYR